MKRFRSFVAVATVALALLAGCNAMEKRYRRVMDRDDRREDRDERRVELNTAGPKRLAKLPGLTADDADRIIANRPYKNRRDLVRKGVLSEARFERMRDQVYVEHERD